MRHSIDNTSQEIKNEEFKEYYIKLQWLFKKQSVENKRLRRENKLFQQVLDNLPCRVYWKDNQGVYLGYNVCEMERAAARRSFLGKGEKIRNLKGKTDDELYSSDVAAIYRQSDEDVITTGKSWKKEVNFINSDGRSSTELTSKVPLLDEQGRRIGVMGYSFDITYLKSLETKVIDAQVSEIAFIRHMEHGIRMPFSSIIGLVNILLNKEEDTEKKGFLEDISLYARELLGYCTRILDFSKITIKSLPLVAVPFELRDIVDSVMHITEPVAKIKRLQFSLSYTESLPRTVIGYPYRLKCILVNLLNNALQFTEQGRIQLTVKPEVSVGDAMTVQFIIDDTGIGMSSEKQAALREQWNDASAVANDQYEGKGLGLRVVYQFTQDIGGKITFHSQEGKGSCFICYITFKLAESK